jgi:hypothetical protein
MMKGREKKKEAVPDRKSRRNEIYKQKLEEEWKTRFF